MILTKEIEYRTVKNIVLAAWYVGWMSGKINGIDHPDCKGEREILVGLLLTEK